jgi:hypothetical protein
MRSSVPLHPVDKAEEDPEQESLFANYEGAEDIDDIDPLLPDSDLMIERLKNELETELAGADAYERTIIKSYRISLTDPFRSKPDRKPGDSRYGYGSISMGAFRTLWVWLVCRQVRSPNQI